MDMYLTGRAMAEESPSAPVFFIHIMKTAGTTIRNCIRSQFDDRELYPSRRFDSDLHFANSSIEYLLSVPAPRRARIRAYMGHFPYVAAQLLRRELLTLTVLRHPVSRTISHLKHLRVFSHQHKQLQLEEVYEDPFMQPMFLRNHQAKMFAFTEADAPRTYEEVLEIDDRRLTLAKQNLDKVDLVGITEHFDDFLGLVERRFGWRVNGSRRLRVGPTGGVSDSLRRRIAADNAADLDFYEYACRLCGRTASLHAEESST